jgi:hypothetical protein
MIVNEDLRANDLRYLVDNIFEVDSYSSKMGNDKDISVLSFSVKSKEAAKDLESFIEKGYKFVLDADVSPGEVKNNRYKVYVEMERDNNLKTKIMEILDGVKKLSDNKDFKFRYYRSFKTNDVTEKDLEIIPTSSQDYENRINAVQMENVDNFFNKSYLENIDFEDNTIKLDKTYSGTLDLVIKDFGLKQRIYESANGPFQMSSVDVSEILFLTKFLGPYNINKIGNQFIIENEDYALLTEFKR